MTAPEKTHELPVGAALPHESAHLHVAGVAPYLDDIPELKGTLYGAFATSPAAHGRIRGLDLAAAQQLRGVVTVLTAADIPARNNAGPSVIDDPLLAKDTVVFHGQAVALVVADSYETARRAARLVKADIETLPALLTVDEAAAAESWVLPPVDVKRGDAAAALSAAPHRLKGTARVGGQEHFYLEGQAAYALPREDGGLHIHSSTQHPTEMQHLAAELLGWEAHRVSVECRRMGGGFGGKESQSGLVACAAALGAWVTGKPVKVRLDRDDDMAMTGKRHDFRIQYEVGFDHEGRILGLSIELASRCGYSPDLSGPVNDRAVFHIDNTYYLDAVAVRSLRCLTNTVSNTAFRGFGGPQGLFAIESVVDDIARTLGRDPLDVRRVNFYGPSDGSERNTTHYGMKVEDNIAPELVAQLERTSDYRRRRREIETFNAGSRFVKRGIALTPVKFGISFTATFYNQAGALVHVYADGSVLVTHGGTEMGQGLYTKIRQIVAHELGISVDLVRLLPTDTSRVPNTSATAASSGTDLNGKAAQAAARAILERLTAFASSQSSVVSAETWSELVAKAYKARIKLWESGFYATPKIHYDAKTMQGRPFFYFAYGACCAEVEIDTLTGENRVLRADILHDAGRSLNPAIDRGQIEGGFVQGTGWVTTEELWWTPDGKLWTHAPSTYKIPAASDVPRDLRVDFWQADNVEDSIHRSKAVGEPPLMHGLAVWFALKDAVASVTGGNPALTAPATPEAILRALGSL
jgi:xanthine dehydrogenase large subunit